MLGCKYCTNIASRQHGTCIFIVLTEGSVALLMAPGSSLIPCTIWVVRIGMHHFLAECHKRRLNQCLLFCSFTFVLARASFFVCILCSMCHFVSLLLIVSTSAIDCLERLISEMTYHVSSGMEAPHMARRHTNSVKLTPSVLTKGFHYSL